MPQQPDRDIEDAINVLASVNNEIEFKKTLSKVVDQRKKNLEYQVNVFYENRLPYVIKQTMQEIQEVLHKQLECEPFSPYNKNLQEILSLLCSALELIPRKEKTNES